LSRHYRTTGTCWDLTALKAFTFLVLWRELSRLLGCEVDLATPDSLHKAIKKDVLKEAIRAA